ncbi:MAG: PilZ domain-containing protein [bacterium]|nr:PilZ domain-containing protein [bacterium]
MTNDKKRQVILIVPAQESIDLYKGYLSAYKNKEFSFKYFKSFEELSMEMSGIWNYAGFIIDLRCILKAQECDKEFFYYLLENFPVIRITHSRDKKIVNGNIQGLSLQNRELFDYFFKSIHLPSKAEMENKVVIISKNKESLALYEEQLAQYDEFNIECYSSGSEFLENTSPQNLFTGFLIDLRTTIKASFEEKELYTEIFNSFPAIRISHSIDKKTIKGSIGTNNLSNKELFDCLKKECNLFKPRGIRRQQRKELFLNLNVTAGDQLIKTNSGDLSKGGCFIITNHEVKIGAPISVVINELLIPTPIKGVVKWVLPWGRSSHHLPGFGIAFTSINPEQQKELLDLFKKTK